jgi:hypothetical protein
MTAHIHDRCGWVDDPDRGRPCPCRTDPVTERLARAEVDRRHQEAVARARAADARRVGRAAA